MQSVAALPLHLPHDEENEDIHLSPAFTDQDEQAERTTLTTAELFHAEADLRGITLGLANLQMGQGQGASLTTGAAGAQYPHPHPQQEQGIAPPISVAGALSRLEEELVKLPPEKRASYSRAVVQCANLVSAERKMAFLEREGHDPIAAAKRLALYWQMKLDLFGPDRCYLPMTLNGAMAGEAKAMAERQCVQLLPVKDTAGRAIIYMVPSRRNREVYSTEQELRAYFYLLEVAIEDPDVRRRGVVFLANAKDLQKKHYCIKFMGQMRKFTMDAMPTHHRGCHACHPSWIAYYVITPLYNYAVGRELRQRFRMHYGSDEKVLRDLEGFCIPRDRVPTDLGGTLVFDMVKWVSDRLALESARHVVSRVEGPIAKLNCSAHVKEEEEEEVFGSTSSRHQKRKVQKGKKSLSKKGRPSDPRMIRAIDARLADPRMKLQDALVKGGFTFESTDELGEPIDGSNISLTQRKNQLFRRIRQAKKARMEQQQQQQQLHVVEQQQQAPQEVQSSTTAAEIHSDGTPTSTPNLKDLTKRAQATMSSGRPPPLRLASSSTLTNEQPFTRRDSFDDAIEEVVGDLDNIEYGGNVPVPVPEPTLVANKAPAPEVHVGISDIITPDLDETARGTPTGTVLPTERRDSFDDAISEIADLDSMSKSMDIFSVGP